jgi:hypothetical protein
MDTHATFPKTLIEAIGYFDNSDVCLSFLRDLRWPNGVVCPRCGSRGVTFLAKARVWKCRTPHDHQKFSIKVGTIFEDSPIALGKWLAAIWMVTNCKNGISSCEMARDLGVTQKTAWFMDHRIRLSLHNGTFDYNQRALTDAERFRLVCGNLIGKRLTYRGLIGQASGGQA